MKLVPAALEQQINRVDRQRSLYIGIGNALVALWCLYRVFWGLYLAMTFNWVAGAMIPQVLLWGVIGVIAGVVAFGFLTRYFRES
jgi:hypothetical protein